MNEDFAIKSLTVLVVDDGDIELKLMQHYLSSAPGYEIIAHYANNSECAMNLLEEHAIDVCFYDYYLNGETGVDLVEKMREKGISKPVIMVTGLDNDDMHQLRLKEDITSTLSKELLSSQSISECLQSVFPE